VDYFCFPLDRKYVATHSNEKAVILYSAIRTEKPQTEAVVKYCGATNAGANPNRNANK
jgi:hypothetical protein